MTVSYVLTASAEADLREIIRYTRKQWGKVQVRRYVAELERGIKHLATGQGAFKNMAALYPELRMLHCGHHYIFCLPRDNAPAIVVAIFHERMDLMARLIGRLNSGVSPDPAAFKAGFSPIGPVPRSNRGSTAVATASGNSRRSSNAGWR